MSPCACQNFPVATITELKSHFKHLSSQTISLGWGDAIGHQEVRRKVILSVYNSQTMISPSKGRYEMLLLQPVSPSLPMTTYIQVNRRTTAHSKVQQCEPPSLLNLYFKLELSCLPVTHFHSITSLAARIIE